MVSGGRPLLALLVAALAAAAAGAPGAVAPRAFPGHMRGPAAAPPPQKQQALPQQQQAAPQPAEHEPQAQPTARSFLALMSQMRQATHAAHSAAPTPALTSNVWLDKLVKMAAGKGATPTPLPANSAPAGPALTQTSEHTKVQSGGDPWWLKNPPWWMPPPPSWGPLPPTFYNEYYREPKEIPPIFTANTYPLNRRAFDIEPPLGASLALKTNNQDKDIRPSIDLLPPKEPKPLEGGALPGNPSAGPYNPFLSLKGAGGFFLEESASTTPVFLETASSTTPGEPSAEFTPASLSGPKTIAEHLINAQVVQVPPELRYDRQHRYGKYWRGRYQWAQDHGHPYGYKFAPQYPPDRNKFMHEFAERRKPFGNLPHPRPSWFSISPTFPSRYDEATAYQMGKLAAVRREESDPFSEQLIRERTAADIALYNQ